MYLGKDKKLVETGTTLVVPFCTDCGSQEIKAVYTCKNCKSHNIKFPNIIDNDDERALKKETREIDVYKYKCDICGKEYEWTTKNETPNNIYCDNNTFGVGEIYSDYNDNFNYKFKEDICPNCLNKITNILNKELDNIFDSRHIESIKNQFKVSDKNTVELDVYDFDAITLAAPTQYIFRDNTNIQYYFRYRWGKYKLYKYYNTSQEKVIYEGEYGNSLDGYISVQGFIDLIKKNHNVNIIIVSYKEE